MECVLQKHLPTYPGGASHPATNSTTWKAEMKKPKILIVDDEILVREDLLDCLSGNYDCATADSCAAARAAFAKGGFAVLITDIDLGDGSGFDLAAEMTEKSPDTVVIMISGNQGFEYAVRAKSKGAFAFIPKPFKIDAIEAAVEHAVNRHRVLLQESSFKKDRMSSDMPETMFRLRAAFR
jgi:DNA-binding NtrC family response regulator